MGTGFDPNIMLSSSGGVSGGSDSDLQFPANQGLLPRCIAYLFSLIRAKELEVRGFSVAMEI